MEQEQTNVRTPPGDKAANDLLLMLDEESKQVKVIAGESNPGTKPKKGLPLDDPTEFFQYFRNETWLENFLKNYDRQAENPTRWKILQMSMDDFNSKEVKDAIKDIKNGKTGTQAVKDLYEKHEVKPELLEEIKNNLKKVNSMSETITKKDDWRIDPAELNLAGIEKEWGITPDYLMNMKQFDRMMKGMESDILIPVSKKESGLYDFRGVAVLSFRDVDGVKGLRVTSPDPYPDFKKPYYGHYFNADNVENFAKTRHMGSVANLKINGQVVPCFMSIHPLMNKIHHCPVADVRVNRVIGKVDVGDEGVEHLMSGKRLLAKEIPRNDGSGEFDAYLQISAVKRGVDFDIQRKMFQGQSLGGATLTRDEQNKINAGEAVRVNGMKRKNDPDALPFDRFVKLNLETGDMAFLKYNPDQPVGDREVIIPRHIGGVELDDEQYKKASDFEPIWVEGMTDQKGNETSQYVLIDSDTGYEMKSSRNDFFEEKKKEIPQYIFKSKYTANERKDLQEGKEIKKNVTMMDGSKRSLFIIQDQKTGDMKHSTTSFKEQQDQKNDQAEGKKQEENAPKKKGKITLC